MRVVVWLGLALAVARPVLAVEPAANERREEQQERQSMVAPTKAETEAVQKTYFLARHMEAVARIGEQKGNENVRAFAKDMGAEYRTLSAELARWAENNRVSLQGKEPDKYKDQIENLQGLQGTQFERAFTDLVARENRRAVDDLDKITSDTQNRAFKDEMLRARGVLEKYGREAERRGGRTGV